MIYTLTLNTSLDYVIHIDELKTGEINKSSEYKIYPGGKGINVSLVLKELGLESTAMGFVAGHTGQWLESILASQGIHTEFVHLSEGITRINVKIRSKEEKTLQPVETDINFSGPIVTREELEEQKALLASVKTGDFVIISGSVPATVTVEDYRSIVQMLSEQGAYVVVDVAGEYLKAILECKPFLVKPNKEEIEELLNIRVDENNVEELARMLINMGAQNVLVSLGGDGGILCCSNGESIVMKAPKGRAVNTVGAGDSMVAGFVAGYLKKADYTYAMKLGIGAGSATAFKDGLASLNEIKAVVECM